MVSTKGAGPGRAAERKPSYRSLLDAMRDQRESRPKPVDPRIVDALYREMFPEQ